MIKKILIALAIVIVAFLLIGFLLPGKLEISRSISINAPAENVFEELNDLKKWQEWQYWNTLDTAMVVTFGEKTVGTGASYAWEGNSKVGEGTITITESVPNSSVASDLAFTGFNPAKAVYTVEPKGDSTKATLNVIIDFGMNPIGRWVGLVMMKNELKKAFDYGLANIKQRAEAKQKFTVDISETETPALYYIGVSSGTMSTEDFVAINAKMEQLFTQVSTDLNKAKVQTSGPAFALFSKWDEASKQMVMVCGFPVDEKAKVPAKYKVQQLPAGKAVKAVNRGAYAKLADTHMQVNQYIQTRNLSIAGAPWESYLTDPHIEKDTAAWVTEVYYPVQ